ncbi:MAG: DUF6712 family protein [Phocaeicola sp.]
MNHIIPDIDTLRTVVKLNSQVPEESISPYIEDALSIYIEPQVGASIIELANTDDKLTGMILRALGALTLALSTDEFGIQYGDAGITVENNQGKRSPANEAKIAAAKKSLFYRGMQALDRLIDYLERNEYPDYQAHKKERGVVKCFIQTAQQFQDVGCVHIDYSTLTYRTLLPIIVQLQERTLRDTLKEAYEPLLEETLEGTKTSIIKDLIIKFLANKTAELYTSQATREERSNTTATPEYKPILRPVYSDMTETGNFFADQATYWLNRITDFLTNNADYFGVTIERTALKFNGPDKKIFTSIR